MTDTADLVARTDAPVPLVLDVGVAAATAGLTLVDPTRLGPAGRFALRSSEAAVVGALTWFGLGQVPELEWQPDRRVAIVAGAVGATYAFAELSETLDARISRGLRRRGVRRPRAVMALAAAGLTVGLSVLDRRLTSSVRVEDDDEEVGPQVRTLPEPVRRIVAAILEQTEDYDSLRLRAQLAVAGEEVWGEDDDFSRMLEVAVPDDVPLAVPHTFTFPVSGRFVSPRGVPCEVQLLVAQGRLATVLIDVAGADWDELADDWDPAGGDPDPLADIERWPGPEELTFVQESSGRP